MPHNRKELSMRYMRDQEMNTYRKYLNFTHRLAARTLCRGIYLNRQMWIKYSRLIQRKVLKGIHLPVTVKEVQAQYSNSPYVKGVYLYIV